MPTELHGASADQPREHHEAHEPAPADVVGSREWVDDFRDRLAGITERAKEKAFDAAAERGQTREQWESYEALRDEDTQQASKLESARYDLRAGPPDWMGGQQFTPEAKKNELHADARDREGQALEYFRKEPVEGPENKPIDPERVRPWIQWCKGDPPIPPGDLQNRDDVVYVRPERRDVQDPKSGLGKPEAEPDPRLTPEQHQEKIDEQRGHAADVLGRENWSNSKYAGKTYDKLTPALQERFPDGVQFTDEGFPMLDRYAVKTVTFEEGFRGPTRDDDFQRANAIFGWTRRPPAGLTWHHKEDGRTMLLVDERLHRKVGHYGGVAASKAMGLWEGED